MNQIMKKQIKSLNLNKSLNNKINRVNKYNLKLKKINLLKTWLNMLLFHQKIQEMKMKTKKNKLINNQILKILKNKNLNKLNKMKINSNKHQKLNKIKIKLLKLLNKKM